MFLDVLAELYFALEVVLEFVEEEVVEALLGNYVAPPFFEPADRLRRVVALVVVFPPLVRVDGLCRVEEARQVVRALQLLLYHDFFRVVGVLVVRCLHRFFCLCRWAPVVDLHRVILMKVSTFDFAGEPDVALLCQFEQVVVVFADAVVVLSPVLLLTQHASDLSDVVALVPEGLLLPA